MNADRGDRLARKHTQAFFYDGLWPPSFLVEALGYRLEEDGAARHLAVVQATWAQYQAVLGDTPAAQRRGYPSLLAMEEALGARLAAVQEQTALARADCAYHERVFRVIEEDGQVHGMETPLGVAFPGQIAIGSAAWERGWDRNGEPEPAEEGLTGATAGAGDEPLTFALRRAEGACVLDGDGAGAPRPFVFAAQVPFTEALEGVRQRYQLAEQTYRRWRATELLLSFRYAVVQNVRWQFDLYGTVEALTRETAGLMIQGAGTGRRSGVDYEAVAAMLQDLVDLPEMQHPPGKYGGRPNVAALVRGIERRSDALDGVSERRARTIITDLIRKMNDSEVGRK